MSPRVAPRYWVVSTGEPLPIDGVNVRLYRAGVLARALGAAGATVNWWTARFSHREKEHRSSPSTRPAVLPGVDLQLLNSPGYRSHVSIRRLADHAVLGAHAAQLMASAEPPDAIYCAYPTIELAAAVARYAKPRGIPFLLDVRDLWPDIFERGFPPSLRGLSRALFAPYRWLARSALMSADRLVSVTDEMLEWGLRLVGRTRGAFDEAIPLGFSRPEVPLTAQTEANRWLGEQGIVLDQRRPLVLYAGVITRQVDLAAIATAARLLNERGQDATVVVLGTGDRLPELRALANGCSSIRCLGWVDQAVIQALASRAAAGLLCYRPTFDFESGLPNKVGEYLSYGLPIISSLEKGPAARFLRSHSAGAHYPFGDGEALAARMLEGIAAWRHRGEQPDKRLQQVQLTHLDAANTTARLAKIMSEMARR